MVETTRVSENNCKTVDELWQTLAPAGGRFDHTDRRFVFRGQRESTWSLVPKAFRSDVIERYKRGMMGVRKDHTGQWFFEWALLDSFLACCDSIGLSIPEDSIEFRRYFSLSNISNIHGIHNSEWPQERVESLMALAQHHGIPTRLLDWSDNPYVACYHAAESVVREDIDGSGRLAIFALEFTRIRRDTRLKQVRVPGSTSPNIAFQKGFVYPGFEFRVSGRSFHTGRIPRVPTSGRSRTDVAQIDFAEIARTRTAIEMPQIRNFRCISFPGV